MHRATHADLEIMAETDLQLPAGHIDVDLIVNLAQLAHYAGCRAAAATGCCRKSGPPLPDTYAQRRAVNNFNELHIRASGEQRMVFNLRA